MIYKPDPFKIMILLILFGVGVCLGAFLKQPKVVEVEKIVNGVAEPTSVADYIRGECPPAEVIEVYRGMVDDINTTGKVKIINTGKLLLDNDEEYNIEDIKRDTLSIDVLKK